MVDQTAEASQRNVQVAQQRVGYDYGAPAVESHYDDHHHDHHDPGYWKKKVVWKEGYKKIWKPAKKQIQKPAWKKVYKPVWIPTQREEWVPTKGEALRMCFESVYLNEKLLFDLSFCAMSS